MIKSMTGYGKAEVNLAGQKITIEIKSLNSKQLDVNLRLSPAYREKEPEIRQWIASALVRGKVDCSVYRESNGAEGNHSINHELGVSYFYDLEKLRRQLDLPPEAVLSTLVKMPDMLKPVQAELSEKEFETFQSAFMQVAKQLDDYRVQEGIALEADFALRIHTIQELADQLKPLEEERMDHTKKRLEQALKEMAESTNHDKNRFEQELIYYLEKLDITEEKVRLKQHCVYFLETMKNDENQGKKLAFIAQEIGREINTIGSKANHALMQKLVVQMKDELEKIKEQLSNIL